MPILMIEPDGEARGMAEAPPPPFRALSGAPIPVDLPTLLLMPGGDPDEESEEDDLDDEDDEDDLDEDEEEDDLEDDEEFDDEEELDEDEEEDEEE